MSRGSRAAGQWGPPDTRATPCGCRASSPSSFQESRLWGVTGSLAPGEAAEGGGRGLGRCLRSDGVSQVTPLRRVCFLGEWMTF